MLSCAQTQGSSSGSSDCQEQKLPVFIEASRRGTSEPGTQAGSNTGEGAILLLCVPREETVPSFSVPE